MNTAELSYIKLSWEGILVKIENTSEFIAIVKNFNQVFRNPVMGSIADNLTITITDCDKYLIYDREMWGDLDLQIWFNTNGLYVKCENIASTILPYKTAFTQANVETELEWPFDENMVPLLNFEIKPIKHIIVPDNSGIAEVLDIIYALKIDSSRDVFIERQNSEEIQLFLTSNSKTTLMESGLIQELSYLLDKVKKICADSSIIYIISHPNTIFNPQEPPLGENP